ncbi:MAG: ferric reductase [Pseudomonadota bacterium]
MVRFRVFLIWAALLTALVIPIAIAATSPLLAWRQPVYILAGFAGVIAMGLLLLQPLLAGGYLPGVAARLGRRLHLWVGIGVVAAVAIHVGALWITSPPDVIDVLLFRSPTPFSVWGVLAMWAVFFTALLAAFRKRFGLKPKIWRFWHLTLAAIIVSGSVIHALLIEGTMGTLSKAVLCTLAIAALIKVLIDQKVWTLLRRRRA